VKTHACVVQELINSLPPCQGFGTVGTVVGIVVGIFVGICCWHCSGLEGTVGTGCRAMNHCTCLAATDLNSQADSPPAACRPDRENNNITCCCLTCYSNLSQATPHRLCSSVPVTRQQLLKEGQRHDKSGNPSSAGGGGVSVAVGYLDSAMPGLSPPCPLEKQMEAWRFLC